VHYCHICNLQRIEISSRIFAYVYDVSSLKVNVVPEISLVIITKRKTQNVYKPRPRYYVSADLFFGILKKITLSKVGCLAKIY
jgi:hypothetical protein